MTNIDPIEIKNLMESLLDSEAGTALNEAAGTLAQLPPAWVKLATKRGGTSRLGGENSEIVVLSGGTGIKNISRLRNLVLEGLDAAVAGKYAFLWISINGEPLFGIGADNWTKRAEFFLYGPDKAIVTKDHRKLHWTGKMVGRGDARKYVPQQWAEFERRSFKKNEAFDKVVYGVISTIENMISSSENPGQDVNAFMGTQSIELKAITQDEVRLAKAADRKANKPTDFNTQMAAQRKEVIKKYTLKRITPLINSIKSKLPTQEMIDKMLADALDGKEVRSINIAQDVSNDLAKLNSIVARVADIAKKDSVQLVKPGWRGGAEAGEYQLDSLINALKRLTEALDLLERKGLI